MLCFVACVAVSYASPNVSSSIAFHLCLSLLYCYLVDRYTYLFNFLNMCKVFLKVHVHNMKINLHRRLIRCLLNIDMPYLIGECLHGI